MIIVNKEDLRKNLNSKVSLKKEIDEKDILTNLHKLGIECFWLNNNKWIVIKSNDIK